ncbi:MAG: hypothetical protein J6Y98_01955 [Bacteroidales bacterium]|nr:hypothetical protein [Bacteroidales bacterium]MCR5192977.1 hypothetical protein [Bacteroidales bacterium]
MAAIHIDEVKAMAKKAYDDAATMESYFEAVFDDDNGEAVHYAWALTHLPRAADQSIAAHRDDLVARATTTANVSLRRICLALLNRIDWPLDAADEEVPQSYITLLDFCLMHMMMADETYGVRSLCMKLAYTLCLPYPELMGELRRSLLMIEPSNLGAGVKHTRNKLLNTIK